MGVGLWIDLLHRGGGSSRGMPRDNFRSTGASLSDGSGRGGSSITTKQFLWVKIAAVLVYAVEILVAIGLRNNNQYQKWRPGPFLRVFLFVLFHRNTRQIWTLHIFMVPHFLEIFILVVCFVFFYAILSMNVFQTGHEGNHHFSDVGIIRIHRSSSRSSASTPSFNSSPFFFKKSYS
jgi:hypothetical protein